MGFELKNMLNHIIHMNFLFYFFWKTNAIQVASVAIGNPERHVRKALHRGSKQQ